MDIAASDASSSSTGSDVAELTDTIELPVTAKRCSLHTSVPGRIYALARMEMVVVVKT